MSTPGDRLKQARAKAGYEKAKAAAEAMGVPYYTYAQHENGTRGLPSDAADRYARFFRVPAEWLLWGRGASDPDGSMVPILGYVGADPSGEIIFATGQQTGDMAPAPPGGRALPVVEVKGHSMRGFADDGSLIYYENQRSRPSREMLGEVVVVQTKDGQVLVKRLLRGSGPDVWDLESVAGPTMSDMEIEWVAEIAYIMPPLRARRSVVRAHTDAA